MIIPQQGDDIDFPAAPAAWHAGTKRRDNLRGSWGFWNKQKCSFQEGDDPKKKKSKFEQRHSKIKVDLSLRISRNEICHLGVQSRDLANASCRVGSFQELH